MTEIQATIVGHEMDDEHPVAVVRCPYCDKRHRHGAPDADDDGIRASHCHNGEYRIVDPAPKQCTSHILYRFFDAEDTLLYIGITKNPVNRFKNHQHDKTWFNKVVRSTMQHFNSRAELAAAEIVAIQTERPRYNKAHTVSPTPPVRMHRQSKAESVFGPDANRFHTEPSTPDDEYVPPPRLWQSQPCPDCLTIGRVFQPADENWQETTGERTCLACGGHWTYKEWFTKTTGLDW